MSKQYKMIKLMPDPMGNTHEHMESKGHQCEHCKGFGYFWGTGPKGSCVRMDCSVCGGTGELDAVIDITWTPSEKK